MTSSELDKIINIERETTVINAVGTPTEEYSFLKETYANIKVKSGSSEYTDEGTLPFTRVEFVIRYDKRVDYKCRINYKTQYYEIGHIEELGRKQWLKIRCVVWDDALNR